jgi:hypothetical protein
MTMRFEPPGWFRRLGAYRLPPARQARALNAIVGWLKVKAARRRRRRQMLQALRQLARLGTLWP